jgi:hypothetical protein
MCVPGAVVQKGRTNPTTYSQMTMLLQTLLALLLLEVSLVIATPTQTTAKPLITAPPSLADRAVTSFHTIVSTSYPQNRWSIGYGKIEGENDFCMNLGRATIGVRNADTFW